MNDSILDSLNLDKLNIKDLTLLLKIVEEIQPNEHNESQEEIEVI